MRRTGQPQATTPAKILGDLATRVSRLEFRRRGSFEFIGEEVRASAGQLVFDDLPTTFRHLRIVAELQCVNATQLAMRFNGDNGTNYDSAWQYAAVNNSTPIYVDNGGNWQLDRFKWSFVSDAIPGDGDSWAHVVIDIPYYRGSRTKQVIVAISSLAAGEFYSVRGAGRFYPTDPVTEIEVFAAGTSANLVTASRASLYGIG